MSVCVCVCGHRWLSGLHSGLLMERLGVLAPVGIRQGETLLFVAVWLCGCVAVWLCGCECECVCVCVCVCVLGCGSRGVCSHLKCMSPRVSTSHFSSLHPLPSHIHTYALPCQVRTKDDALIKVKLMIFFELREIETMLNKTTDPVADFIKSVSLSLWTVRLKYSINVHKLNLGSLQFACTSLPTNITTHRYLPPPSLSLCSAVTADVIAFASQLT